MLHGNNQNNKEQITNLNKDIEKQNQRRKNARVLSEILEKHL
jgi:hypothetical protein